MNGFYFVYKFIGKNNETLYVGQTINIDRRMIEHQGTIWDKEKDHIEFAECKTKADMNLYEMYYINKLNAKYNTALVFNDSPSFDLPELEWKTYDKNIYLEEEQERNRNITNRIFERCKNPSYWNNKINTLEELIKTKTEECEDYKDSQEYEFEKRRLEEYKQIYNERCS